MGRVKVSVITPVYNVEEYIGETLESLVKQTLSPIEIIMVDDGSSDKSPDIIKSYQEKYNNIIYVEQENAGPGAARNKGIGLANGEYISFVDSDDILPSDALENLYNAAIERNVELVIGASESFNKNETWFIASHYNNGVYKEGYKNLISNQELLYSLGPCNKLYSKTLIQDMRFPTSIKVTEDQPFVIEAYLRAGSKIFTIDKIIYRYRTREATDNLSLSQTAIVNSIKVMQDIMKSMLISDQIWDQYIDNRVARYQLKKYYYNRLTTADIWPALRNAIDSRNKDAQLDTLNVFISWVKALDNTLFNDIPALHTVIYRNIINRYDLLTAPAKREYLRLATIAHEKVSLKVNVSTKPSNASFRAVMNAGRKKSSLPLLKYIYGRKYHRAVAKIKTAFLRRILFPACGYLPLQNKITFATNKSQELQDSFEYIHNQLLIARPGYKMVGHFKIQGGFKDFAKLYYDIATSKYVILDDYYRPLYKLKTRKRTEVIQTWHAAGAFKKFGHSAVGYRESNTKEFENEAHGSYAKVAVTSKEIIPYYAEAFHISEENVLPVGLPRTDLFSNEEEMEYIKQKYRGTYPVLRNKKVITYAPTFRGGPGKRASFNIQLDLKRMAEELSDEYVLLLKLHPSVTKSIDIPKEAQEFVINMSKNNINNVLSITDILISDYSSVIFEYALLERPMIFFAYDLEDYLQDRSFYYEYKDFIPGPLAEKTEEVISLIQQKSFDMDKVKAFKRRFFDDTDGNASKRFVETFIEPITNSD